MRFSSISSSKPKVRVPEIPMNVRSQPRHDPSGFGSVAGDSTAAGQYLERRVSTQLKRGEPVVLQPREKFRGPDGAILTIPGIEMFRVCDEILIVYGLP